MSDAALASNGSAGLPAPAVMTGGSLTISGDSCQIVTFRIDDRFFGVDVQAVREIKSWIETTPLPHAPQHVRGVLNLRGVILAVYDLRARLGLGLTQAGAAHVIVVVAIGDRLVGLLVDSVSDILAVSPSDIRPLPDVGSSEDGLLTGLILREDGLIALLHLGAVLGDAGPDAAMAAQALAS